MSAVGAGLEPDIFLNFKQSNKFVRANEANLRKTLNNFKQRQEATATSELLRKTHLESRQALMPQVRIRNVSNEYKLVAGVFSPELLHLEERWGKPDPIDAYQTEQSTIYGQQQKQQAHQQS